MRQEARSKKQEARGRKPEGESLILYLASCIFNRRFLGYNNYRDGG